MYDRQIVFLDSDEELHELSQNYTVVETMRFGDAGLAAVAEVESEQALSELNYMAVENYPDTLAATIPIEDESHISTKAGDWADLSDIQTLHNTTAGDGDGSTITWAVMDSGIDPGHKLFREGQIVERHDFTDSGSNDAVGHGTACAGLITQLAPNVELIDLRIFGARGKTSLRVILRAYEWLFNNTDKVDGVNMSWGAAKRVRKLDRLQNKLVENGVRDVTAAGNTGKKGGSPATADSAFATGACDKNGRMASFSSYNPNLGNPEVAALGKNVKLARAQGTSMGRVVNKDWVVASGTSFSAPIVSGLVAKYLSVNPKATVPELRQLFIDGADNIEGVPEDGAGLVNYRNSIKRSTEAAETATATVWSFAGRDSVYISEDWLDDGKYTVKKTDFLDAFGQ